MNKTKIGKKIVVTMIGNGEKPNTVTAVIVTKCNQDNGFHDDNDKCCVSAAMNRAVAKLHKSRRYYFCSEYETFGSDFRGRVGSASPSGGSNLDECVSGNFI